MSAGPDECAELAGSIASGYLRAGSIASGYLRGMLQTNVETLLRRLVLAERERVLKVFEETMRQWRNGDSLPLPMVIGETIRRIREGEP